MSLGRTGWRAYRSVGSLDDVRPPRRRLGRWEAGGVVVVETEAVIGIDNLLHLMLLTYKICLYEAPCAY